MKLQQLFFHLKDVNQTLPPLEIENVVCDTRQVQLGSLFVAVRGETADGHDYLEEAVKRGALVLVVDQPQKIPANYTGVVVRVEDTRSLLDKLGSTFYGHPAQSLYCVGVTGTNGKTSLTYLIEAILNEANQPTAVIGTINHHFQHQVWPTDMTTPDPLSLQKRLSEFVQAGAKAVAMEVSSHALSQRRADSVSFDSVVFTNLTRDHLDYHKSMSNYFAAKQRLFSDLLWKSSKTQIQAIVNSDDIYGRRLRIADRADLWTYGENNADFRFEMLSSDYNRSVFKALTPFGNEEVDLSMGGRHNVMNALAAMAVGLSAGAKLSQVIQALKKFSGVPGRLQTAPNSEGKYIFIDYAHTPDALENVLQSIQKVRASQKKKNAIWTVFGCGGDRDQGKRPLMATAAEKYSDYVVVTSDNPRTEEPQAILNQIAKGFTQLKESTFFEADRSKAIELALTKSQAGDVILIAGKGHEDYQIIGKTKTPFSDFEVVSKYYSGGRR